MAAYFAKGLRIFFLIPQFAILATGNYLHNLDINENNLENIKVDILW